jgi:hypothetical protein
MEQTESQAVQAVFSEAVDSAHEALDERASEVVRPHAAAERDPVLIAGGIITAIALSRTRFGRLVLSVIAGTFMLGRFGDRSAAERRERHGYVSSGSSSWRDEMYSSRSRATARASESFGYSRRVHAMEDEFLGASSWLREKRSFWRDLARILVKGESPTALRRVPVSIQKWRQLTTHPIFVDLPLEDLPISMQRSDIRGGSGDGDEPPPFEWTGGGGDGGGPPNRRRINAWIFETEGSEDRRLTRGETYTLNINVGKPHSASLVPPEVSDVASDDIPPQGLQTEWVITSKYVLLSAAPAEDTVKFHHGSDPLSTAATFSLLIPASGDSLTRRLRVTATSNVAGEADLSVIIFAHGTLFRQFRIELNIGDAKRIGYGSLRASAQVTADYEHVNPQDTGLLPQHEWQTPDGYLTISVTGAGKAIYSGDVWSPDSGKVWDANFADWVVSLPVAAGPIRNVQDAADKVRQAFTRELNDIDEKDLAERLEALAHDHSRFYAEGADATHEEAWKKIAASDQMYQLAYYGYELYKTFFPERSKLRRVLDNLPPNWRVDLTWAKQIDPNWFPHVPWTLMYIRAPQPGEPIDALNFLGLRWRIAYVAHFSEVPPSRALGGLRAVTCAYGMYWGEDDPELVREVQWQQSQWKLWGSPVFAPDGDTDIPRKQQVLAFFNKKAAKPTPLVYCYCHCELGDGNKPVLRFGRTPSPEDNIRLFDIAQSPLAYAPIVFINACGSAASDPYIANALAENFFDRGCRSYLGPVVKIPVRFASRFAKIFYTFFFGDIAVEPIAAGEAVFQARRFLWREYRNVAGLFYAYTNMYDVYMAAQADLEKLRTHRGATA